MKEDKEKHLEAVKSELSQKIEAIMGPPPNEKQSAEKEASNPAHKPEVEKQAGKVVKPESAPVAKGAAVASKETSVRPKPESKPAPAALPAEPGDAELDKAVDDIMAREGDDLLKSEDNEVQRAFFDVGSQKGFLDKLRGFFVAWWQNRKARRITIAVLLLILLAIFTVPQSRYFVLNNVGVRSSASVKILDESTQQPLKNVTVTINDQSGVTNDEGVATLGHLKLGQAEVKIERVAFAPSAKTVTLGWGSNPLSDISLKPVGLQYSFRTVDFLSNTPVVKAEAVSGAASAFANENGDIILTLDTKDERAVEVSIKANGYREEKVISTKDKVIEVKMVPDRKHAFVSKRSGKYDIYKIDADGKNEELVLSGTGAEKDDMVLAAHPEANVAALVSTRENLRNVDGYLLNSLTMLNLDTGKKESVARAERFQIVGWVDDRLVYVQVTSGTSANNPKRQRLMSYDILSNQTTEIATSNYFNDVIVAKDKIYYAPSGAYQNGINVSLFVVNADGQNKSVLIENETWNLFRTGYDTLTIAVGEAWYDYKIGGSEKPASLAGAPANPKSRLYIDGPDNKHGIWIDQRDGKGVLLSYDLERKEDKNLVAQSGLSNPARWLNDSTVVYRIHTDQETADYVVSLNGGEPKKVVDVTNTAGLEDWYYY